MAMSDRLITSFDNLPLVLTVEQMASVLCIGRNTAYELIRAGTISSVRAGRCIRVPKQAIMEYLSTQAHKGKGL